ncbi:MAG TPA: HAD-IIIA family hydrolase [Steroidobacteraceae bacterium]|nr:HAD-IIIA family hydrolase [Steroidobacteraceae bacterium]
MRIKHVILDRDGVLNRDLPAGEWVHDPQAFEWLDGALAGLAQLARAGVRLCVATNQSGVGRGRMSLDQLQAVHARMLADAAAHGAPIADVLVCPHAPEAGCSCRKPAPGLILAAMARSGLAPADTLVVGDDSRDIEAAARAGVEAALVCTGKGARTAMQLVARGTPVRTYADLEQLARALTMEHD